MRAIVASPLGLLIGLVLGALGGGGSILAVPLLVYAAGQEPRAATATSLVVVGSAAVMGLWTHWRAGRVCTGIGLGFGAAGIGGSLVGSALNRNFDPDLLLLSFSGLVLIAAERMRGGRVTAGDRAEPGTARPALGASVQTGLAARPCRALDPRRAGGILLVGTGVGLLTGLFGVGGGFVVVPALVLILDMPMPQAVGTSLLVIAINSAVALATRLAVASSIEWSVTVPFTIAALAGVGIGGSIAGRVDAARSQAWFARLLVVVALYTAARALNALL